MAWRTKPGATEERIARIRRFDGFYERRLRERRKDALANELTVAEMEVLQELGDAEGQWGTPSWLCWRAGLDPGYLSRIIKRFREQGIVSVGGCALDQRQHEIALTDLGRRIYRSVEDLRSHRTRELLEVLPERQQRRLIHAMEVIEEVLTRSPMENLFERFSIKSFSAE